MDSDSDSSVLTLILVIFIAVLILVMAYGEGQRFNSIEKKLDRVIATTTTHQVKVGN